MNNKLSFIVLSILVHKSVANQNYDEEYVDSVINLLLSGESFEDISSSKDDIPTDEPLYEDGLWRCGNCDVIDESKLLYSEVNNVETNALEDVPIEVQVGLTVSGMQCVTISSSALVRVVSGRCAGAYVTLAVRAAGEFDVRVYGNGVTRY